MIEFAIGFAVGTAFGLIVLWLVVRPHLLEANLHVLTLSRRLEKAERERDRR